jgi:hypothetical protein
MELSDKSFVLSMLSMPRLGLSPSQVQEIESIIDGRPLPDSPKVMSYAKAADVLGLTSKNRTKTILYWVREGFLQAVCPPGRKKSVGVSAESVAAFIASRKKREVVNG